jgi:hypothetical protein
MSFKILDRLKSAGVDIALNAVNSIPVVGGLVSGIGKVLLGKDDASEQEVENAIQNATPHELELIKLEIDKQKQETEQESLKLQQREAEREIKGMDFLVKFFDIISKQKTAKSWLICYIAYFHIAFGVILWYSGKPEFADDDLMSFIHKSVLIIVISAPVIPMALIFRPIYGVIEALCASVATMLSLPKSVVGGLGSAIASKLSNKKNNS